MYFSLITLGIIYETILLNLKCSVLFCFFLSMFPCHLPLAREMFYRKCILSSVLVYWVLRFHSANSFQRQTDFENSYSAVLIYSRPLRGENSLSSAPLTFVFDYTRMKTYGQEKGSEQISQELKHMCCGFFIMNQ